MKLAQKSKQNGQTSQKCQQNCQTKQKKSIRQAGKKGHQIVQLAQTRSTKYFSEADPINYAQYLMPEFGTVMHQTQCSNGLTLVHDCAKLRHKKLCWICWVCLRKILCGTQYGKYPSNTQTPHRCAKPGIQEIVLNLLSALGSYLNCLSCLTCLSLPKWPILFWLSFTRMYTFSRLTHLMLHNAQCNVCLSVMAPEGQVLTRLIFSDVENLSLLWSHSVTNIHRVG